VTRSDSLAAQIACVRREIALREKVYPNWVRTGRMTKAEAEDQISTMRDVLVTLLALKGEPTQQSFL
jgi:hypothetical protein